MAEVFVISPLINLGLFLGTWLWKKYQQSDIDREHNREARQLVAAVERLATFVSSKGKQLGDYQHTFGKHSESLGHIFLSLNWEINGRGSSSGD
jgi:hypothetical protein